MPKSAPPKVLARLTVLPVAEFLSLNVPVLATLKSSPATLSLKLALVVDTLATVLPSYVLLAAVIPLKLIAFLAMSAVVVLYSVML